MVRFEEAADFNKWEAADKLKHICVSLEETARQWSSCDPVGTPATWEEFKVDLLETFQHQHFRPRVSEQLRKRQQQPLESAVAYYYDCSIFVARSMKFPKSK